MKRRPVPKKKRSSRPEPDPKRRVREMPDKKVKKYGAIFAILEEEMEEVTEEPEP